MQLTAYLFNQEIQARFNKPNTLRNTVFWNKPLKLYKGADNFIDIVVNDFDLQAVVVDLYDFNFKIKNRTQDIVFSKNITVRTGINNRLALDLLEAELEPLQPGMYTWGISLTDENLKKRPLYLELNGSAEGTLTIAKWFSGALP